MDARMVANVKAKKIFEELETGTKLMVSCIRDNRRVDKYDIVEVSDASYNDDLICIKQIEGVFDYRPFVEDEYNELKTIRLVSLKGMSDEDIFLLRLSL